MSTLVSQTPGTPLVDLGTFRKELFAEQSIRPIPLLLQLNDWVIKQNEKRLPKWKFRFASDLAVQIHSRLTRKYALLFECSALQCEGVSAKFFTQPTLLQEQQRWWRIQFKLFATEGSETWVVKPTYAMRGRHCSRGEYLEFKRRTIDVLTPDRFRELKPDLMLSPHCLCCGKGLTDPVSMARWIGPECWGSASTNLPNIFKAMAA
jgi:hypothetical protein